MGKGTAGLLITLLPLFIISCSFDYDDNSEESRGQPDIVMNVVEYVRVRSGDPQLRFKAELAERYEERQVMDLRDFTFEQFGSHEEKVNAMGSAGSAHMELDSGNVNLRDGVSIVVETEDVTIETEKLDWEDKKRTLSGGADDEVRILRENGTSFYGRGFIVNTRSRTWEFTGGAGGTYIYDDEDEDAE
jgi:LPS export ABC transporter protein LptC